MAAAARYLMMRGLNITDGTTPLPVYQTQSNSTDNDTASTLALIQNLRFAQSKTIRTSTIILATFNVLAALATASSILYDCYWASKRSNPKFKASKFCISSIHPAESFPLVLSVGIVIQGIIFANVQGMGIGSLNTHGCGHIAQYMWPALFIVPYLQLVFGLECAIRSLRKRPFQARGKYDVAICGVVVILMLVGTWIPSHIYPEKDFCFASLVWFISRFGRLGFIMLSAIAVLMIISALTIFFRLSTTHVIDQHQRIAASRMVYYLVLGIASLAFIIPYFASWVIGKGDLKCAMIATVVLNLSGLMSGLLQLFLRSNTATTSFGPRGEDDAWDHQKHEIRMFGPNELAYSNHLTEPVSGPRTADDEFDNRSDSRLGLVDGYEKNRVVSMESLQSPPFQSPIQYKNASRGDHVTPLEQVGMPTLPSPSVASTTQSNLRQNGHARKKSYNLYPSPIGASPLRPQPNLHSEYDDKLAPPPAIFGGRGHRRDSSVASSATVQIGLRLSHALQDMTQSALPASAYTAIMAQSVSPPPLIATQGAASETIGRAAIRPSPLQTDFRPVVQSPAQGSSINKTLPPTPNVLSPARVAQPRVSTTQLSPAVYSPQKKVSSPRELTTPRSAGALRKSPLTSPVTQVERPNSQRGPVNGTKPEWI